MIASQAEVVVAAVQFQDTEKERDSKGARRVASGADLARAFSSGAYFTMSQKEKASTTATTALVVSLAGGSSSLSGIKRKSSARDPSSSRMRGKNHTRFPVNTQMAANTSSRTAGARVSEHSAECRAQNHW